MELKTFKNRNSEQGRELLSIDVLNWATGINIQRTGLNPKLKILAMTQSHPTPDEIMLSILYE